VPTEFEGELKMLEDRLVNPRIDKEDYIIVAGIGYSRKLSCIIEEENC
jgi:hypothetical protein